MEDPLGSQREGFESLRQQKAISCELFSGHCATLRQEYDGKRGTDSSESSVLNAGQEIPRVNFKNPPKDGGQEVANSSSEILTYYAGRANTTTHITQLWRLCKSMPYLPR